MNWYTIFEALVGWTANLIQIATAIFAFVVVWRARRKLKAMLRLPGETTESQVAIAIGIRGSIAGAVKHHFENMDPPSTIQIFEIVRESTITQREAYQVLREVNQLKQKLTEEGVTRVHLFYKGPVTLAMGIGALLDNWVPVTAYDFHDGRYEPTLLLGKGTVFDIAEEIVAEGEEVVIDRTLEG